MFTTSPQGYIYWSAVSYHVGSHIFVLNALLAWVAHAYPATELPGQIDYGVGLTTLPGTILFWLGAYLEFLDVNKQARFRSSLAHRDADDESQCGISDIFPNKQIAEIDAESHLRELKSCRSRWLPNQLTTHHMHDTTFQACVIQLCGATVFIMIGMVDLPGIFPELTPLQKVSQEAHGF